MSTLHNLELEHINGTDLSNILEKINTNFDHLYHSDIYKGAPGDTAEIRLLKLVEVDQNNPEEHTWTEVGLKLLSCIFDEEFTEDSILTFESTDINKKKLSYFLDDAESNINGTSDWAWFYVDDIPLCPATPFIFIDPYTIESNDYTCMVIGTCTGETEDPITGDISLEISYSKSTLYPSLYYDDNALDGEGAWCWLINGVKTGIPASQRGVKSNTVARHPYFFLMKEKLDENGDKINNQYLYYEPRISSLTHTEDENMAGYINYEDYKTSPSNKPVAGDFGYLIEKEIVTIPSGDSSIPDREEDRYILRILRCISGENESWGGATDAYMISYDETYMKWIWQYVWSLFGTYTCEQHDLDKEHGFKFRDPWDSVEDYDINTCKGHYVDTLRHDKNHDGQSIDDVDKSILNFYYGGRYSDKESEDYKPGYVNFENYEGVTINNKEVWFEDTPKCVSVTYNEFINKIANEELIEGNIYKIIGYYGTISGDMYIYVQAVSKTEYNHKGFAYSTKLREVYEICWDLNGNLITNLPSLLTGSEPSRTPCGTIYWMEDKDENEAPYDFINIPTFNNDSDNNIIAKCNKITAYFENNERYYNDITIYGSHNTLDGCKNIEFYGCDNIFTNCTCSNKQKFVESFKYDDEKLENKGIVRINNSSFTNIDIDRPFAVITYIYNDCNITNTHITDVNSSNLILTNLTYYTQEYTQATKNDITSYYKIHELEEHIRDLNSPVYVIYADSSTVRTETFGIYINNTDKSNIFNINTSDITHSIRDIHIPSDFMDVDIEVVDPGSLDGKTQLSFYQESNGDPSEDLAAKGSYTMSDFGYAYAYEADRIVTVNTYSHYSTATVHSLGSPGLGDTSLSEFASAARAAYNAISGLPYPAAHTYKALIEYIRFPWDGTWHKVISKTGGYQISDSGLWFEDVTLSNHGKATYTVEMKSTPYSTVKSQTNSNNNSTVNRDVVTTYECHTIRIELYDAGETITEEDGTITVADNKSARVTSHTVNNEDVIRYTYNNNRGGMESSNAAKDKVIMTLPQYQVAYQYFLYDTDNFNLTASNTIAEPIDNESIPQNSQEVQINDAVAHAISSIPNTSHYCLSTITLPQLSANIDNPASITIGEGDDAIRYIFGGWALYKNVQTGTKTNTDKSGHITSTTPIYTPTPFNYKEGSTYMVSDSDVINDKIYFRAIWIQSDEPVKFYKEFSTSYYKANINFKSLTDKEMFDNTRIGRDISGNTSYYDLQRGGVKKSITFKLVDDNGDELSDDDVKSMNICNIIAYKRGNLGGPDNASTSYNSKGIYSVMNEVKKTGMSYPGMPTNKSNIGIYEMGYPGLWEPTEIGYPYSESAYMGQKIINPTANLQASSTKQYIDNGDYNGSMDKYQIDSLGVYYNGNLLPKFSSILSENNITIDLSYNEMLEEAGYKPQISKIIIEYLYDATANIPKDTTEYFVSSYDRGTDGYNNDHADYLENYEDFSIPDHTYELCRKIYYITDDFKTNNILNSPDEESYGTYGLAFNPNKQTIYFHKKGEESPEGIIAPQIIDYSSKTGDNRRSPTIDKNNIIEGTPAATKAYRDAMYAWSGWLPAYYFSGYQSNSDFYTPISRNVNQINAITTFNNNSGFESTDDRQLYYAYKIINIDSLNSGLTFPSQKNAGVSRENYQWYYSNGNGTTHEWIQFIMYPFLINKAYHLINTNSLKVESNIQATIKNYNMYYDRNGWGVAEIWKGTFRSDIELIACKVSKLGGDHPNYNVTFI